MGFDPPSHEVVDPEILFGIFGCFNGVHGGMMGGMGLDVPVIEIIVVEQAHLDQGLDIDLDVVLMGKREGLEGHEDGMDKGVGVLVLLKIQQASVFF